MTGTEKCYFSCVQSGLRTLEPFERHEVFEYISSVSFFCFCYSKPFLRQTAEDIENIFRVNVFSQMWLVHEFWEEMSQIEGKRYLSNSFFLFLYHLGFEVQCIKIRFECPTFRCIVSYWGKRCVQAIPDKASCPKGHAKFTTYKAQWMGVSCPTMIPLLCPNFSTILVICPLLLKGAISEFRFLFWLVNYLTLIKHLGRTQLHPLNLPFQGQSFAFS